MSIAAASISDMMKLVVSRKEIVADGVAEFTLIDPAENLLPTHDAGSHIDLHLDNGLVRQYSLCGDPAEQTKYVLGVQRERDGRGGSAFMHDRLSVGDVVTVGHPRNAFPLDETATQSILVAGGIGVTPLLAMAYRLHALKRDFIFVYRARSVERMAFLRSLDQMPFSDRMRLHFDNGPEDQRFNPEVVADDALSGAHLYVCGSRRFMDDVITHATPRLGAHAIHREYFDAALPSAEDRAFKIKIVSTGDIYDVAANETVVEVLTRHGIEIPVSCEQGICGTCVTGVIEGEIDHRDMVLTEADRLRNNKMTVCCSRAVGDMIILDL